MNHRFACLFAAAAAGVTVTVTVWGCRNASDSASTTTPAGQQTTGATASLEPHPCGKNMSTSATLFEGEQDSRVGPAVRRARMVYEQWQARNLRDYALVVKCGSTGGDIAPALRSPLNTYAITVRDGRAVEGWASDPSGRHRMNANEAGLFTVEALFRVMRTVIARCMRDTVCTLAAASPDGSNFHADGSYSQGATELDGLTTDGSFPKSFGFSEWEQRVEATAHTLVVSEFRPLTREP